MNRFSKRLLPLVIGISILGPAFSSRLLAETSKTTFQHTAYHGWADALVLGNGKVEAVVVPAVGRVMQFRFVGEQDGPFWENRALDGKAPDPKSAEWGNFGGDKTWPSPQADWPKIAPRGWPPPAAFDSMPVQAEFKEGAIILTSPVDPHYGIRTVRRIELVSDQPKMTILTTYEKVEGVPRHVGVWVVTQLKDPVVVYAPISVNSQYSAGYNKQSDELPLNLEVKNQMLSLKRNPKASHKVGVDGGTLLWIGERAAVRIDSPRVSGEYPDEGSSAEVYTNPNPLTYVELEMLGPLTTMKIGDKISRASSYTLLRRSQSTPEEEARQLLR